MLPAWLAGGGIIAPGPSLPAKGLFWILPALYAAAVEEEQNQIKMFQYWCINILQPGIMMGQHQHINLDKWLVFLHSVCLQLYLQTNINIKALDNKTEYTPMYNNVIAYPKFQ